MKTSPWLRWLIAAMALFALLLFAACGDDDDDDGGDGNGDATSTPDGDPNQPDEGDDEDDEQGDAPSGDDADYVAHICTSMGEFVDELIAIGTDPANQDATEEEQLELSREPFAALVDAMENADPPGDIEEYHDQLVEGFREVLERIEDGDVAAFETDPFEELPEPPAAVAEKYEALANQVPECASTGVFGEE